MKEKNKSKGIILALGNLLYISLSLFFLISCTSISKKVPLNSEKLSLKIEWAYSDPGQKQTKSFSSFVFLQGKQALRLDLFQNFVGVVGSLILHDQVLTIQAPLSKEYYVGTFDSQLFFPEFPSFPGLWLIDMLRAEASEDWDCEKQKKRISKCKTDFFEITWVYQKAGLYKIRLKDSMRRRITARIKSLSIGKFSEDIFEPSMASWTKKEEPLFFQSL